MLIKFKLGACNFSFGFRKELWSSQVGYGRVNGMHFDFWCYTRLGFYARFVRRRESDIHPKCHAGWLVSDLQANPNLPCW